MKREAGISLSIGALVVALSAPQMVLAKNAEGLTKASNDSAVMAGAHEATTMVPARVALVKDLDAKKIQQGSEFRTKLSGKVQLKDGTELASGTMLIGTVATDKMQENGTSMLALRFTQAELKGGKTLPIKATIVGVFGPESESGEGYDIVAGEQAPNNWNAKTLQVDQEGVISGVDLHSRIASQDSGSFVSSKKHDVKLERGTELALALAVRS